MSGLFGRSRRDDSLPLETPASDTDSSGTPLDGLLAQMRDLRLTLAADLTTAAAAAEDGAEGVAADIVEADRLELARFARVADQRLLRLQRLAVAGPQAPTWRRRIVVALPVVPVVGALAISAAAATGVLPLPTGPSHKSPAISARAAANTPVATFRALMDVIGDNPSASEVIAAAAKLHQQLAALIASSPDNPSNAAEIAQLLRMEQSLLLREQPPGATVVLDETRLLAARLVKVAPQLTSPTSVPQTVPTVSPSKRPRPATSSTPRPSSSPKPSSSPSTTSSSHSPSPTSAPFPALPN